MSALSRDERSKPVSPSTPDGVSPSERPTLSDAELAEQLLATIQAATDPTIMKRVNGAGGAVSHRIGAESTTLIDCLQTVRERARGSEYQTVCDLSQKSDSSRRGFDKVLVVADGILKVEQRKRTFPLEVLDGVFHVPYERYDLRELSPEDLVDFRLRTEQDLIDLFAQNAEPAPVGAKSDSIVRASGQNVILLQPTEYGPKDGITIDYSDTGVRVGFSMAPLPEESVEALLIKSRFIAKVMSPQAADYFISHILAVEIEQRQGEMSDTVKGRLNFKLHMAFEELYLNIFGHNIFGRRLTELRDSDAQVKGRLLEILSGERSGQIALEFELSGDEVIIRAFQPEPFRFNSPLSDGVASATQGSVIGDPQAQEQQAFIAWWDCAEQATDDDRIELPTGRGALLLKQLLHLKASIDPRTHTMTFRANLKDWLD